MQASRCAGTVRLIAPGGDEALGDRQPRAAVDDAGLVEAMITLESFDTEASLAAVLPIDLHLVAGVVEHGLTDRDFVVGLRGRGQGERQQQTQPT